MAKLVVLKKGGGGRVAINPEQIAFIRSATGAFTDVFLNGQQVAVEGTFDEVVRCLATPERRAAEPQPPDEGPKLAFSPPHV